jgi:hypothetical protein
VSWIDVTTLTVSVGQTLQLACTFDAGARRGTGCRLHVLLEGRGV